MSREMKTLAALASGCIILAVLGVVCLGGGAGIWMLTRRGARGPVGARATVQARVKATMTALAISPSPTSTPLATPAPPPSAAETPAAAQPLTQAGADIPDDLKNAYLIIYFIHWSTQESIKVVEGLQRGEIQQQEAMGRVTATLTGLDQAEGELAAIPPIAGLETAWTKAQEGLGRVKSTLTNWSNGRLNTVPATVELKRGYGSLDEALKTLEGHLKGEYNASAEDLERLREEAKDRF